MRHIKSCKVTKKEDWHLGLHNVFKWIQNELPQMWSHKACRTACVRVCFFIVINLVLICEELNLMISAGLERRGRRNLVALFDFFLCTFTFIEARVTGEGFHVLLKGTVFLVTATKVDKKYVESP